MYLPWNTKRPGLGTCASPRRSTGPCRPSPTAAASSSLNVPHARAPLWCANAAIRPFPSLDTVTSTSAHGPMTARPLMPIEIAPELVPPHCSMQCALHCAGPAEALQLSRFAVHWTVPLAAFPLNLPSKLIVPVPFDQLAGPL